MNDENKVRGVLLKMREETIDEIKDYQVVIGFSGFGNVGYLSLSHFIEKLDLVTISMWGGSSWYYKNNLESIITAYKHEMSKTIFVLPRLPIHVSSISIRFWDQLVMDILNWNAKKYIVIGGLRELKRDVVSKQWAEYALNQSWKKKFKEVHTFGDKLAMIGPLSSFLMKGTIMDIPVMGLLVYCNDEEDPEASLMAVNELNSICKLKLKKTDELFEFDYSFIPGGEISELYEDEELKDNDDEEIPGYDLSDLT